VTFRAASRKSSLFATPAPAVGPVLAMPPAFGDSESDRLSLAHIVLEAWARRKKQRLRFQQIVREARELFLDERALDAGALDSQFYTNSALVVRKQLMESGPVQRAMAAAWKSVSKACGDGSGQRELHYEDYVTMMRKIYLQQKIVARDADVDVDDFYRSLKADWTEDARGKPTLNEDDFKRCWFQLVDTYTETVVADDYEAWVAGTLEAILSGESEWRSDDSLFDELKVVTKRDPRLHARLKSWNSAFALDPPKMDTRTSKRAKPTPAAAPPPPVSIVLPAAEEAELEWDNSRAPPRPPTRPPPSSPDGSPPMIRLASPRAVSSWSIPASPRRPSSAPVTVPKGPRLVTPTRPKRPWQPPPMPAWKVPYLEVRDDRCLPLIT